MRKVRFLVLMLVAASFFFVFGGLEAWAAESERDRLVKYDGGFFSIEIPKGWQLTTAGECASFAFVAHDPQDLARQILYFGEVGPVYMNAEQKQLDLQYMNMGGYPVTWIEMPVVQPLTPETFLEHFQDIANTQIARNFMPSCPEFQNLQSIAITLQPCLITGGSTALVRALFTQDGEVAEGLFLLTVAPVIGYTGNPGGSIAYGFSLTGITAPKDEFKQLENMLVRCLESFTISNSYVNQCLQQQAEAYRGIFKAGRTLSETSDIIMQGWENRNRSEDILAEKRSDAILGTERLYDPETGDVYEFENGFFDRYDLERNSYEMNNLELLPDGDYDLWMKPTLNGSNHLR